MSLRKQLLVMTFLALTTVGLLAQERLPVTSPVRRITYDASSRRILRGWEAPDSVAAVVYDNTCSSGRYYGGLPSAAQGGGSQSGAIVDHGRIPGSASPPTTFVRTGCAESYAIDELTIGYCTTSGQPADIVMRFWYPIVGNQFCLSSPFFDGSTELAELRLMGLPGSGSPGSPACYLVNVVNLRGLTIPGSDTSGDRFAWSFQMPNTMGGDGPFFAGNPSFGGCAPGDGTIWDTVQPTPEEGTGIGNPDWAWYERFGGPSGCDTTFSWNGYYLELRSSGACSGVVPFCFGNAWDCPCANAGQPGHGCENAALTGGVRLDAGAFLPDGAGGGAATLAGTGFPPQAFPAVVAIRAPDPEHPPLPFGDGLRCVGAAGLVRVGAALAQAGAVTLPLSHGAGAGIFSYQLWYRSNPASYCTPSGFNLSNGLQLTW